MAMVWCWWVHDLFLMALEIVVCDGLVVVIGGDVLGFFVASSDGWLANDGGW